MTLLHFTNWGYILILLFYLGLLTKYQHSILIILILTSLCSLYMNYINPGYISFIYKNTKYKLSKPVSLYVDIIAHHLPLVIFIVYYNNKIPKDNLIFAFVVIILYLLFFNPFSIYDINVNGRSSDDGGGYKIINLN
jgi:hypothetical protein